MNPYHHGTPGADMPDFSFLPHNVMSYTGNPYYLCRLPRGKKALKRDAYQGAVLFLACLAFLFALGAVVGKFSSPTPAAPTRPANDARPERAAGGGVWRPWDGFTV